MAQLRPTDTLLSLLSRFSEARVAVIGDVMLDRYVYGSVQRISPEAPVPVLRIEREIAMAGGAGNVAQNIAALGGHVALVGAVGDDAAASEIVALLQSDAHIQPWLSKETVRSTTVKVRYVAQSQQIMRADNESTQHVAATTQAEILNKIKDIAKSHNVFLLSDYGKGVLSGNLAPALIDFVRQSGGQVVVDPKGKDYEKYSGADVVTPNHHELAEASRMPTDSDDEVIAAARSLLDRIDMKAVIATRGPRGMALVDRSGGTLLVPAVTRDVFDVSGAGDTAVATLAVALSAGISLQDAMVLANSAAGIVVGKLGTATCSVAELAASLAAPTRPTPEDKIVDASDLKRRVIQWRQTGKKIGFTNGCFDLLHPGHVSLFQQAKATCDRLVVALNDDNSVRRLKGNDRPVNSERSRAIVIASLADVDLVTIFADNTPLSLIKAIRPDVLIKGADYALNEVVGGDFVRSYGGKIVLAELSHGFSTTNIVRKMAAQAKTAV
jgi:D-beta-D-heptose 7-phosphate kinase / D-beta-D-heptose 1-phosphate adenosyltransferase